MEKKFKELQRGDNIYKIVKDDSIDGFKIIKFTVNDRIQYLENHIIIEFNNEQETFPIDDVSITTNYATFATSFKEAVDLLKRKYISEINDINEKIEELSIKKERYKKIVNGEPNEQDVLVDKTTILS